MSTRGAVRYHFFVLVLILLGVLLYLDALSAPFVYDDRGYILQNHAIRSLSNFWNFSGTRYVGYLSFALNYSIGGLTPFDFHLTNVFIHIVNSILVFYLVIVTFRTPVIEGFRPGKTAGAAIPVAVVSSLIFLAHPVQTQAVTYVTQRFASLATLFYLLSVLLYVKARLPGRPGAGPSVQGAGPLVTKKRLLYLGALVSTVLAMKTKEISFTIPFVIALYDYLFFPRDEIKETARLRIPFYLTLLIIPLSLIGPAFLTASDTVSEMIRRAQVEEAVTFGRGVYVMTQFRVIVTYIRLLLLPVNQRLDYDYPYSYSMLEPATLGSFLLLSSLVAFSIYVLRRSYASRNPYGLLFSFGVFWFFITLTVESFMVPIQDVIFEQRVYLPGIGFIVSLVAGAFYFVDLLRRRYRASLSNAVAAAIMLVLVLPPLSYALHKRNLVWGDELVLIKESIGESIGKERLYYFSALANIDREEYLSVVVDSSNAILLHPMFYEAYHLRGFAYIKLGMYERAVSDLTTAIVFRPEVRLYRYNRGVAYEGLKRFDDAVRDYTMAIELGPDYALAYNNRGLVYAGTGFAARAASDLEKACSLGHAEACENLMVLKRSSGAGSARALAETR